MNGPKNLKYGLMLLGVGALAYIGVPYLIKLTLDLLTLVVLGGVGLVLWFVYPAFCEFLATLGWRLWEAAIRYDPTARLERDVIAHARQLNQLEEKISEANAEVENLKGILRQSRGQLGEEELAQWQEQLTVLAEAGRKLVGIRDEELRRHEDFKREVAKAKAQHRLGQAFKGALGAFNFASKSGPTSVGSSVALDAVRNQLSSSQSRLSLILSRKAAELALEGGDTKP